MKKKYDKKNKGITLVALIVTIIILLILAGVSIASLTESGLFEKARRAEQKSENAQIKEDTTLADYENKIDAYINNDRNNQVINSNFVELTATFAENIAAFQYPQGYSKDNTYIISTKALRTGTTYWYERYAFANKTTNKEEIVLGDTTINWQLIVDGVTFTDAKILIMKIDV